MSTSSKKPTRPPTEGQISPSAMKRLFVQKNPPVDVPLTTSMLPSIFASPLIDPTLEILQDADPEVEIDSQELMSASTGTRLNTIDTETTFTLGSQHSNIEEETYQSLYERWMGFSNIEREMEKEMFTANGFLPEFYNRRQAQHLRIRQELRTFSPITK